MPSPVQPLPVHLVAAARPNFMKVAPLYHELRARSWCEPLVVHSGQHYDVNMSDAFFRDLRMPEPAFHLGVGSGTHAEQTGRVMIAYEKVCLEHRPACTIVVGDVNTTMACAITCAKLGIPVVHLEAGLRSRDRTMPEEINRLVTDAISDLLWTPSPDGDENLRHEGVEPAKICRIGNIMIDSFEMLREQIAAADTRERLGLAPRGYGIVTLHRPSNVDDPEKLAELVHALVAVSRMLDLVFAVHPRTRKRLQDTGLMPQLEAAAPRIRLTEPLGYIEFMNLVTQAAVTITDSGGVQEETTYLGIPCITLRRNTERPVTVTEGTNRLLEVADLEAAVRRIREGGWPAGRRPDLWDGRTAARAADSLAGLLGVPQR